MGVRIRLARFGCKNRPFYRVVAASTLARRDGKHLENLGYYNPLPATMLLKVGALYIVGPWAFRGSAQGLCAVGKAGAWKYLVNSSHEDGGKRMGLNFERVKYWLSVGAQPSDPVQNLLFRAGVLPPPPMVAMGRKGGPRDMRLVDPLTGRIIADKPATNGAVASALEAANSNKEKASA